MTAQSVIVLGGPDSGKTNFIGRLWRALDTLQGAYVAAAVPDDITFVSDTAEHLFEGRFAPRTHMNDGRRDFEITVRPATGSNETTIVIPDIHGEFWQSAVVNSEIDAAWMSELTRADGALLFVRVQSELNQKPLDWVNSKRLLAKTGEDDDRKKLPTQVMLCELIRFLEHTLAQRADGNRPRLSVLVAAWDLLDAEVSAAGPEKYLKREYPLLGGKLANIETLDVRVFGVSVAGGDLEADAEYRQTFLKQGLDANGWILTKDGDSGQWRRDRDLTLPIAWVVGD